MKKKDRSAQRARESSTACGGGATAVNLRLVALKTLFAAYISIFTKALPSRTIGKVASTTLGGSPP